MGYKLVVCGLYHYRHYAQHLPRPAFQGIVFSHRFGTFKELAGDVQNLWLKEYLLNADVRLTSLQSAYRRLHAYHWLWNREALLRFRPAAVNLVMLQGTCRPVLEMARARRTLVVGEAVNLHPVRLRRILLDDEKHHGVAPLLTEAGVEDKLQEIPLVDFLLAPSQAVQHSYVDAGFRADRIRVVPYPLFSATSTVDAGSKRERPVPRGRPRLAVVGQVSPRKGQFHLLRALAGTPLASRIDIVLVGAADERYLRSLRELGIPFQHVHNLPHPEVMRLIASSAALVLNSLEDGFGMVVGEAVEVGTPVVVSKYAGAAETIQREGGGLVVNPLDYGGVVNALERAVDGDVPVFTGAMRTWQHYAAEVDAVLASLEPSG
jgi:glycosyltransferase involved in cell wall biosynthesis